MANLNIPANNVSGFIRDLAKRNGIKATQNRFDKVAQVVTQLAGDSVLTDEVEGLLVNLNRSGCIAGSEMMILHARYLDEIHAVSIDSSAR